MFPAPLAVVAAAAAVAAFVAEVGRARGNCRSGLWDREWVEGVEGNRKARKNWSRGVEKPLWKYPVKSPHNGCHEDTFLTQQYVT